MFVRIIFFSTFLLVLIRAQFLDNRLNNDLMTSESGKAIISGTGRESIVGNKSIVKGVKGGKIKLAIEGAKTDKKLGKFIGKKFDKKFFKKDKKVGVFGKMKKGIKKYNKKKAFNNVKGLGFKKKSINIKSFTDSKGFKFGKINGFQNEKKFEDIFGKKGAKVKNMKLKKLDQKLKGDKKLLLKFDTKKDGKKLWKTGKVGFKKGDGLLLKKNLKKGKALKKIN